MRPVNVTRHQEFGPDKAPIHEVTVDMPYYRLWGVDELTLRGIALKVGADLAIFGSDSDPDEVVRAVVKLADPDELITVAEVN